MPMPPEAIRLIWAALFLGFPIALLFGWRYDITREGIRRTDTRDGVAEEPLGRTDYGIIGGLSVLAIAIAGFTAAGVLDAIRTAEIETEVAFANSPPAINSIAVLPFDSCEQNPDIEILGSALAAQLIEWLAAGEGLKVIARASSFSFRGSTFGFRQISGTSDSTSSWSIQKASWWRARPSDSLTIRRCPSPIRWWRPSPNGPRASWVSRGRRSWSGPARTWMPTSRRSSAANI